MEINQFLVALSYGDAISNEALEMQIILRRKGYSSQIYGQYVDCRLSAHFHKYEEYKGNSDNICIFHFSIGSELNDFIKTLPDRKVMIYHNLTPAFYFRGFNEYLANQLSNGRSELSDFASRVDFALGDSTFNAQELTTIGYSRVAVQPIIYNFAELEKISLNQKLAEKLRGRKPNIIFVGRIAPNKKHEDVIRAFALYKKIYNSSARLWLIGKYDGMEQYYYKLQGLVARLNLSDVNFTGQLESEDLHTFWQAADVFLSMSEHEGFLVPILEAAYYQVPIIAYGSGAIEETLCQGGILLRDKDYELAAALIHRVVHGRQFGKSIVDGQQRILQTFAYEKTAARFERYIEDLIA